MVLSITTIRTNWFKKTNGNPNLTILWFCYSLFAIIILFYHITAFVFTFVLVSYFSILIILLFFFFKSLFCLNKNKPMEANKRKVRFKC